MREAGGQGGAAKSAVKALTVPGRARQAARPSDTPTAASGATIRVKRVHRSPEVRYLAKLENPWRDAIICD